MNRRHMLGSLAGALAASSLPSHLSFAKELRGKWTKDWIVKYSMWMVEWAWKDLSSRVSTLKTQVDMDVPLGFKYFHGTLDKKDQIYQERFMAAKLSDKDTADHIAKLLK